MWSTPCSNALCSRPTAAARSMGVPSEFPIMPLPVSRIAPYPMRFTSRSPSRHVPAAAAVFTVLLRPWDRQTLEYEAGTARRGRVSGRMKCHIRGGNDPRPPGR